MGQLACFGGPCAGRRSSVRGRSDRGLDLVHGVCQLGAFLGELVIDRGDVLGQVGDQFWVLVERVHGVWGEVCGVAPVSAAPTLWFPYPLAGDLIV